MSSIRRTVVVAVALVCSLLFSPRAHAESGKFNLHLDLAGMIGAPLATGGQGLFGFDWQFRPMFALDFVIGGGVIANLTGTRSNVGYFHTAAGVRFRFLDNKEGYKNEPKGDAQGNLYLVPRLGILLAAKGPLATFDTQLGYEFSVSKPVQIGVFIKPGITFPAPSFYVLAGLNFSFEFGKSPPRDSDKDTLSDERELVKWHTSPYRPDTDADGLTDPREIELGTDPNERDTDKGGSGDGWEVNNKRNPLDPSDDDRDQDKVADERDRCLDTPLGAEVDQFGCTILRQQMVLKGITFQFNSATILPESETTLRGAVQILRDNPKARVEVGGHTDAVGTPEYNLRLSQDRAIAVLNWLAAHGIERDRLEARGYGATQPKAANDTEANRGKNRRIEFRRLDAE